MSESTFVAGSSEIPRPQLARRLVLRALASVHGEITVAEPGGVTRLGQACDAHAERVRVSIHRPRAWRRIAFGGDLGAGESYMDRDWSCDDLPALVRMVLRHTDGLAARLPHPLRRLRHALRRNSPGGSRRNIRDHYDLGNDFFASFLDPTLTYSSAVFEHPEQSLEDAQRAKYERLCRMLAIGPDDRVLEIGTGWGGFAMHAARTTGCRVTTATVSREQAELARRRIADAGLADRIEVRLRDYRELEGRYDKLVSIEMIEAVGARYLETFFRVCAERLRRRGAMALQAITTPDQRYEASVRSVDFIKRYVFPGGQLPSLQAMTTATMRASDLQLVRLEEISPHYAETLRRWRESFHARRRQVRKLGYPERFLRLWEFYLASCEGAFAERYVGAAQLLFARPGWRAHG